MVARNRHVPNQRSFAPKTCWHAPRDRRNRCGPPSPRFAFRIADGPPQRIGEGMQHMPGEEAWLIGERRVSGEHKYYLSNLPADADLKPLPQQSRRVGSANRRISNLRKNSAGPLRRAILAWSASSCADDDDCLRLAQSRSFTETKRGKKNRRRTAATEFARDPPRRSCPSLPRAALYIDAGTAKQCCAKPMNETAKVVLAREKFADNSTWAQPSR